MRDSYGKGTRWLAVFLSACLIWTSIPMTARAEDETLPRGGMEGLCPHHPEHTEECGYAEASEGSPCGYLCKVCEVQALIDALPEADGISAERYEETAEQLAWVDMGKVELSDEEMAQLNIAKYEATVLKLRELAGEQQAEEPAPAATVPASGIGWSLDASGNLTISSNEGMQDWDDKEEAYREQVVSVVIQSGVAKIKESVFQNYSSLASVEISSGVTSIEDYAFNGCSSLKSITIPEGVTSIGYVAFKGCSKLASITIPKSVTNIGSGAFNGCSSLTSIEIPSGVKKIESGTFGWCSSLTSITIPDSVTSIEASTFGWCTSLKDITIPDSVTSIEGSTFYGCSSLKSITIPSEVTKIGYEAFGKCDSLESITIPSKVTEIGYDAFANCRSLTSITMKGETPPTLGVNVFNNGWVGQAIKTIYVPEGSVDAYTSNVEWSAYKNNIVGTTAPTPPAPQKYTVTVNGGTGGGEFEEGAIVTITANNPESGKRFKGWKVDSGSANLAGVSDVTTSFAMPAEAVTVTAEYEDIPQPAPIQQYTVTVDGGTGSGDYDPGVTVTITANDPAEGKQFKEWTVESGNVTLANAQSADTSFTMPAEAVTVKAVYEEKSSEGDSGNAGSSGAVENSGSSSQSSPSVPSSPSSPEKSSNTELASSPVSLSYKIIYGANSIWIQGSVGSLVIGGDGGFDKFAGVMVDGALLDHTHYNASEGSTVIALADAYLNTLPIGVHSFQLLWTDGAAETVFTVVEREVVKEDNPNNDTETSAPPPDLKDDEPKTGDGTPVEMYATLVMVSGLAYLRLYFADLAIGMSEETKKELVAKLVKWAKRGGKPRKFAALAMIFVLLAYYHGIGKKVQVNWHEAYES